MTKLVKQELFKLVKKKSTLILPILLAIYMIVIAIVAKKYTDVLPPTTMITGFFGSSSLITFIMIASASSIIAMETQYGTLKNLLYRKYNRGEVLASKWITLAIYSFVLYAFVAVITIVLQLILFPTHSLGETLESGVTILHSLAINFIGNYVGLWLILSLVLMIACFINSAGVAIAVGIVFYFLTNILSGILAFFIQKFDWLKWNPFNMLNLNAQLVSEKIVKDITHLTTPQLFIGNIVYIIIFLALGHLVFKRKNV